MNEHVNELMNYLPVAISSISKIKIRGVLIKKEAIEIYA